MLHHVPSPALQDRLLAEVARVLAPGAWLVGSDSLVSPLFRLAHWGDTMVLVDPDSLGGSARARGLRASARRARRARVPVPGAARGRVGQHRAALLESLRATRRRTAWATPTRSKTSTRCAAIIGDPIPGLGLKNQSAISDEAREYIERSPFLVLATSDAEGRLDASPKGDEPGFCLIEDERTLVIPDRPGNKLVYGLQNILANPRVGVIFMLPGTPETVRVNGTATLTADPELLARLAARGKPAVLAIRIRVEECFHHCAKAFIRSKLWKPESWSERLQDLVRRDGREADEARRRRRGEVRRRGRRRLPHRSLSRVSATTAARRSRPLLEHGQHLGHQRGEDLHRQRAREVVAARLGPGDDRGEHAEEAVVDQEREGRRARDGPLLEDALAARHHLVAVIARAGLAAHRRGRAVGVAQRAARARGGAALDRGHERALHHRADLGPQHALGPARASARRSVSYGVSAAKRIDSIRRSGTRTPSLAMMPISSASAVGPVGGRAERGGERGHERRERIARCACHCAWMRRNASRSSIVRMRRFCAPRCPERNSQR